MTVLELTSAVSIHLFIFLILVFQKDYCLIITKALYFDIVSTSNGTTLDYASCASNIKLSHLKNNLSHFSYDNESFVLPVTDSGRVKVFVRVRPPRPQENSRKEPIAVNVQELSSQVS